MNDCHRIWTAPRLVIRRTSCMARIVPSRFPHLERLSYDSLFARDHTLLPSHRARLPVGEALAENGSNDPESMQACGLKG